MRTHIHHHFSRFWTAILTPLLIGVIGSLIATNAAQRIDAEEKSAHLNEALKQEVLGNILHLDAAVSEAGMLAMAEIPSQYLFQADFFAFAKRDPWTFHQLEHYSDYEEIYQHFAQVAELIRRPRTLRSIREISVLCKEIREIAHERLIIETPL